MVIRVKKLEINWNDIKDKKQAIKKAKKISQKKKKWEKEILIYIYFIKG